MSAIIRREASVFCTEFATAHPHREAAGCCLRTQTPRLAVPEWDEAKRLNLRCAASDFADADLVFDDRLAPAGSGDGVPPDYTPRLC
jgi:hypothetical protein